ncbi:MAG: ABC transporter A family member, partial [Hydrogenophaga sp.]
DGMPSLLAGPSGALELSLLQEQGGVVEVGNADANMEPPNPSLQALASNGRCVQIRGLRKEFPTPDGTKVAVKALDMTMYEGQIFALLGHNGAGKTTTLSILSGMLPATAGDASVFGLSVASQMASIRRIMGVCPQHDVLFPDLTVLEHLELFAGLKEVPLDVRAQKISEIIAEVGLTEKVYSLSSTLSGVMKRKLSLAIALLGDSRIVFLDEPTSGMDPYSRRSTWSVIQNNRQGRIIVLTTHFMDEADLLGDRIGIMADGELRCCGSPMFLKARFGVGYNLTLVRTP